MITQILKNDCTDLRKLFNRTAYLLLCITGILIWVLFSASFTFALDTNLPKSKVDTKDRNSDGKPDIWIYYNEKGEHIKSEADRNFDGKVDYTRYLAKVKIDREEGDIDFDGAIDTWVYYSDGMKVRGERDTNRDGKPDIFIYYEADKIAGLEKDIDFDGKIDQTTGKIPKK